MNSWIGIILIGFFAGLLARIFSSDPRNPSGCLGTVLLGVVGAACATWVGRQLGIYGADDQAGFIAAVIGSLVVLGVWRAVAHRK